MVSVNDIKNSIEPIARYYGVKKVYLFGSYAKHCETEQSDIDLLIEKRFLYVIVKIIRDETSGGRSIRYFSRFTDTFRNRG